MALGFGAMYADFKAENQAAVQGSFGAILFLFTAVSFEMLTILAASIPAYRLVRSWRWGLHFSSPIMTPDCRRTCSACADRQPDCDDLFAQGHGKNR